MNGFYYLTHVLGILAAIGYMAWIAPRFHFSRLRATACISSALATGYLLMRLLYYLFVGEWGAVNTVRLIVFVPLLAFLFARLFKLPTVQFSDAAAPVVCMAHAIGKIGCQQVGCCESFWEVDFGIYNKRLGLTLFPIQLVEGAISLIIALVLIGMIFKKKGETDGWLMPLMLTLFGFTRFFLEFLRDNKKIVGDLSEFSFWCILMFAVGVIWLIVKKCLSKKKRSQV